jgi:hypothetical protein
MSGPQLAPRARPQQARSQATVERLLQVSAELLEEVGVNGFNTNLLAQRAGVAVRAIYRYFPSCARSTSAPAARCRPTSRPAFASWGSRWTTGG